MSERWEPVEDGNYMQVGDTEPTIGVSGNKLVIWTERNAALTLLPDNLRLCKRVEVEATQPAAEVVWQGSVHVASNKSGWGEAIGITTKHVQDVLLAAKPGQTLRITIERIGGERDG